MVVERDLIDQFLLRSSREGWRFARNNSGVCFHKDGSVVTYGLFTPGGSDLIGWIPHKITPEDVGRTVAVFAAAELKTGKQRPTEAQIRFLNAVALAGGLAAWGKDIDVLMSKLYYE